MNAKDDIKDDIKYDKMIDDDNDEDDGWINFGNVNAPGINFISLNVRQWYFSWICCKFWT